MSGNPFRRPGAANHGREPLRDTPSPPGDEPRRSVPTAGRVKKVQFVSPPQSPDEPHQHKSFPNNLDLDEPPRSPPPQGLSFATIDPAALLRGQDVGDAIQVPNPNAPGGLQSVSSFPQPSLAMNTAVSGAPINPFTRTLATLEPSQKIGAVGDSKDQTGAGSVPQHAQSAKPAMDVDAFTRMLLTGNAGAAQNTPISQTAPRLGNPGVPAVHKDTLYGPTHNYQPQSPRFPGSSSEGTDSEEEADDDDEHSGLMSDSRATDPKPPTPKHKHGRLIKPQGPGPQTVSFDDFDTSFGTPLTAIMSPQSPRLTQLTNGARPMLTRQGSDLNKPLPPPPPPESVSPDPESAISEVNPPSQLPTAQNTSRSEDYLAKKAPPPPPPASRRGGSSRPSVPMTRTRTNSSLNRSTHAPYESSTTSDFATEPLSMEPTQLAGGGAAEEPSAHQVPKMKPPPPPSRSMPKLTPSVSRNSSQQSTSSTGNRRISQNLGAAPPPPPPRRRDAKRVSQDGTSVSPDARRMSNDSRNSSLDMRRISGQSFETGRRDSISSLERVIEHDSPQSSRTTPKPREGFPSVAAPPKDILADLSAFQQEVDALHARVRKTS